MAFFAALALIYDRPDSPPHPSALRPVDSQLGSAGHAIGLVNNVDDDADAHPAGQACRVLMAAQ